MKYERKGINMTGKGAREVVNILEERQKDVKMRGFKLFSILATILLIECGSSRVRALPATFDEVTIQPNIKLDEALESKEPNANTTTISPIVTSTNDTAVPTPADLEAAGSEQSLVTPVDSMETSDNTAAASNIDQSIYGLLPPDAFQQYINQFGPSYPYVPPPYPAPVYAGFVPPPPPPIYPSPYVVQTGYEGYLVPSTATTTTSDNDSTSSSTNTGVMRPLMVLSNIISSLMMSTIFRILATIISSVGLIFFSGAIMNAFCSYTALCEIRNKAVTYVRRAGKAEEEGRTIVEEITPERVRRAAEFVSNAISKYQKLQQLMAERT